MKLTGYLKPLRLFLGEDNRTYFEGVILNVEVRTIYQTTIMQWFEEQVRVNSRENLLESFLGKETTTVENILCDWVEKKVIW